MSARHQICVLAGDGIGPEVTQAAIRVLEGVGFTHGVFNMSPTDHQGLDARARVLVKVENGDWKLVK